MVRRDSNSNHREVNRTYTSYRKIEDERNESLADLNYLSLGYLLVDSLVIIT